MDQIQFDGFMEELIESFIFSINDYTNITKGSASERNEHFKSLLIQNLHKGSFECLLIHLEKTSSRAIQDLKKNLCPGIY